MGATTTETRIQAKGGVIIGIIRAVGLWMEEQQEQHATTLSERTTSREKCGLGTSPWANAHLAFHLYELDKGEYATPGNPIEQTSSTVEKFRGTDGPNGQSIDGKAARFLTKQLRSELETGRE